MGDSPGRVGSFPKQKGTSFVYKPPEVTTVTEEKPKGPQPLLPLERVHCSAIVRSTVERLQLINALPVDIAKRGADMSRTVGDEVTRMIHVQNTLEERFDALFTIRGTLKAMPNKTKYNENQEEARKIASELRSTTELLSRTLRDNPNVSDNVVKAAADRAALASVLSGLLFEIEEKGTYATLTQFVADADEREKTMQETIERERAATARVREVKLLLKSEREEHERDAAEKKRLLAQLKQELKETKETSMVEGSYSRKVLSAQRACDDAQLAEQLAALRAEEHVLRQKLALEAGAHGASADFLGRKAAEMHQEVMDWALRHESSTAAKDKELSLLKAALVRDGIKLKEAEAALARENVLKQQIELLMVKRREEERREKAARRIQRCWRRYWEVKKTALATAKGKKGKGKK